MPITVLMASCFAVLSGIRWGEFYYATTPCLANICTAFPPMYDDVTSLLVQIGRIAHSRLASTGKRPHSGKVFIHTLALCGVSVLRDDPIKTSTTRWWWFFFCFSALWKFDNLIQNLPNSRIVVEFMHSFDNYCICSLYNTPKTTSHCFNNTEFG